MDREDAELPIFAEGSVRRRRAWTVLTMRLAALFKPLYSVTHSSALHSPVPSPLHSVPKERVGWFPSSGNEWKTQSRGPSSPGIHLFPCHCTFFAVSVQN